MCNQTGRWESGLKFHFPNKINLVFDFFQNSHLPVWLHTPLIQNSKPLARQFPSIKIKSMPHVKVENQTSGSLYVYEVSKVTYTATEEETPPTVTLKSSTPLATVKTNKTKDLDVDKNLVLLITRQKGDGSKNGMNLDSQDILFTVGISGGTVLVGSGTVLTKALMWAFFGLMIALIIVVIVLLVIHFKRNHASDKAAAETASALATVNASKTAHPPAAVPARDYIGGKSD